MAGIKPLRARQNLGKYRIERRISTGPRALVYQAYDTIHGAKVALKLPLDLEHEFLDEFRREARLAQKMEHPNVLPIQNASFIDGYFVIAMPASASASRCSRTCLRRWRTHMRARSFTAT